MSTTPTFSDRVGRAGNRFGAFVARRWSLLFGILLLIYAGLPFMAPVFMRVGWELPARAIYTVYSFTCHQLPERSYFLFGESVIYNLDTLQADGAPVSDNILERRRYVGDDEHGYKVALCERDVAIYGAMFLAGIVFVTRKNRVPRLPIKFFVLLLIPIALDGGTQLVGLRMSNWWLRTITGALFGLAVVWLVYPYLVDSMAASPPREE